MDTLHDGTAIGRDGLDDQFFGSDSTGGLLLEVSNSGLQSIFDQRGTLGLRVENRKHCECFCNGLAANQVDNATELADAVTDVFHFSNSLHYFFPPAAVSVLR